MKRISLILLFLFALTATEPMYAQTALPWSEDFEGYATTTLGSEWATPATYDGKPCVFKGNNCWNSPSGLNSLECRADSNNPNIFVFPQFNMPLDSLVVSFTLAGHADGRGQFGYITDANDATTFVKLTDISPQPSTPGYDYYYDTSNYTYYEYDLSTMEGAPHNASYRLAVKYTFVGNDADSWYFDDFRVTNAGIRLNGDLTMALEEGVTYTFYDSGGPFGNYGDDEYYTATFSYDGYITIEFSDFITEWGSNCHESDYDYMYIYDGTTSGTQLAKGQSGCLDANLTINTPYTATSGTMTIVWNSSDDTKTERGWKATITTSPDNVTEIASVADWNAFCFAVNNGHDYSGDTVTMTADVTTAVTTMAGTSDHPFTGTFDGQGHTLTVNINGSVQGAAPFRYINGATIKNLKVEGNVTTTQHHGSGLVGFAWDGTNTIENCRISTHVTNTNAEADNYIGGIVGHGKGSTVNILGCVYDGTLHSEGKVGGMLGWSEEGINLTVTNSIFDGNVENNTNNFHPIAFRNGSVTAYGTYINCYYTKEPTFSETGTSNNLIQTGYTGASHVGVLYKHAYTVEGDANANITVALTGTTSYEYNVSGITGYSTYLDNNSTNSGIVYNNKIYAAYNDQVSLLLSYTDSGTVISYYTDNGFAILTGSATTGTNDAYILTMPESNVTISAETINYCAPAPSSVDNNGITQVTFGYDMVMTNTEHPTSSPFYGNYFDKIGSVPAGLTAYVDITYETGSSYGTIIWVDWNKDFEFGGNEVVYVGTSANDNPTTLNASFVIPVNQATGDYRMRIAGADEFYDDYTSSIEEAAGADPCPTAAWCVVHDYTLRVTEAPSCFPPVGLQAVVTSYSTATLSWTPVGDPASFNIAWKTSSDADFTTISNVESASYVFSNLTPGTTYICKVQANCSSDDHSFYSNECSFVMPTVYSTPFEYPFYSSSLPTDWENKKNRWTGNPVTLENGDFWNFDNTYVFGEYHAKMTVFASNRFGWLITPHIQLSHPYLTFDLALTEANTANSIESYYYGTLGSDDKFIVLISTDDEATWTVLRQWDNAGSEYVYNNIATAGERVAIDLSAYVGQMVRIAFYGESSEGNADNDLHIDNVAINPKTFVTEGSWNEVGNWRPASIPSVDEDVVINANCVIGNEVVAKANNITVNNGKTITIEDGGQLQHNNTGVVATMQKTITGYTNANGKDNYSLMALPFASYTFAGSPFVTGTYDLYAFDGSQQQEWRYQPASIDNGHGFLYANANSSVMNLTGELVPSHQAVSVPLAYDATTTFGAWNLVGNPFACKATPSVDNFYVINGEELSVTSGEIHPMQGIFVKATGPGQSVTFAKSDGAKSAQALNINLVKAGIRDASLIDRARVRFDEGEVLEKFQLNPSHTKVYIPQNGKDYAVVYANNAGEMPVNFKAEKNGSYTLSFNTEEVSFNYLHLIDNMTGNDIDLLATPNVIAGEDPQSPALSYTFYAKTTDYASRFKLVFVCGDANDDNDFAFYSNGNWIISSEGKATLQVIDVNGRIIKSESINGCASISVNAASGVYMLRLINGNDVKVQKVVVR